MEVVVIHTPRVRAPTANEYTFFKTCDVILHIISIISKDCLVRASERMHSRVQYSSEHQRT